MRSTKVLPKGITRKDDGYQVRVVIPKPYQPGLGGKTVFSKRLQDTRRETLEEAQALLAEWKKVIRAEKDRLAELAKPAARPVVGTMAVDLDRAFAVIDKWRDFEILRLRDAYLIRGEFEPTPPRNSAAWFKWSLEWQRVRNILAREDYYEWDETRRAWDELSDFDTRMLKVLADGGIVPHPQTHIMTILRRRFQAAWLAIVDCEDELRAAIDTGHYEPPQPVPTTSQPGTNGVPLLSKVWEQWCENARAENRPEKTITGYRVHIDRLIDFLGDRPVTDYRKPDIKSFVLACRRFPVRLPDEWKSLRFADIIEKTKDSDIETLSIKTVNDKTVAAVASVFSYAEQQDWIDKNPATGQRLDDGGRDQSEPSRIAMDPDQLGKLFRSPVYVAGDRPVGGAGEASFWLPLSLLYAGIRPEDATAIPLEFVREENGVLAVYVAKSKSKAGVRRVPVHSELRRIGFDDYVAWLRQRGERNLFPGMRSESERQSGPFLNWVGDHIRKVVTDDRKVTFYSLRHNFKSALMKADVGMDWVNVLMGHSSGSMMNRYGRDRFGIAYPLDIASEKIERIKFPGLDLSGLRWQPPK